MVLASAYTPRAWNKETNQYIRCNVSCWPVYCVLEVKMKQLITTEVISLSWKQTRCSLDLEDSCHVVILFVVARFCCVSLSALFSCQGGTIHLWKRIARSSSAKSVITATNLYANHLQATVYMMLSPLTFWLCWSRFVLLCFLNNEHNARSHLKREESRSFSMCIAWNGFNSVWSRQES